MLGIVSVKRDTKQVNKSVNHITEGEPTLIQQVRLSREENAIWHGQFLQYKMESDDRFDDINGKFSSIEEKQDQIRGQVAEVKDAASETNDKIEKLFKVVPKRKDDL